MLEAAKLEEKLPAVAAELSRQLAVAVEAKEEFLDASVEHDQLWLFH